MAGLALCAQTPLVVAQVLNEAKTTETVQPRQEQSVLLERRAEVTYDSNILGPGDGLEIELLDLPELSGHFLIGPDGTLHLPLDYVLST